MPIKFRFSAVILTPPLKVKGKRQKEKAGVRRTQSPGLQVCRIAGFLLLPFYFLLFPSSAGAERTVLGVVKNHQVAPKPVAIPSATPQRPEEPLERLAPTGLEVAPNSFEPIANLQAIALQELENLIGRFESAQLAANTTNGFGTEQPSRDTTEVASTGSRLAGLAEPAAKAVAQAREIAKALPQLIDQQDYAAARRQWLKAQQLLWNHYPTDRTLAQPEIRAMWLDRGSIVRAGLEQGLAKIFDALAAAGINTVFFETVNAGYPIYPSKVAQVQNPLVRGWDPLASGVRLAHERGMELHAWVWTFAVGNQRHNALVNLPANYPGPLIAAHPD